MPSIQAPTLAFPGLELCILDSASPLLRPSFGAVFWISLAATNHFSLGSTAFFLDEANRTGGKWIVRLRKGLASRCWENLILAILGEQFMVGEEVCGAVVSVRFQEDIVSIWNRTASDSQTTLRIRDTLRRVLNLPVNTVMEYKTHTDSLRDNSSFRNTDIFLR
ncbi:eukaryotic translation initiation factor 4E type 2-like isoform X2 [Dermacentor variabilis]|uniref:eukaryotic translation initiation factor 4E type 2-like isoform X2 n=1 Tax=Dermacentor variabilis TaxID=34621 RepID=UPI003F5AF345